MIRVAIIDDHAIVRAGLRQFFSEQVDLTVVAEGVETRDQHDAIAALGCHLAQGYLYSRPVDANAATDLLNTDTLARLLARPSVTGAGSRKDG